MHREEEEGGEGSPTIPILRLFEGRPRRIFFSGAGAFLGGILRRFPSVAEEVENKFTRTLKVVGRAVNKGSK